MPQACAQSVAGATAEGDDVHRAGEIDAANAKAAMDRDRLMQGFLEGLNRAPLLPAPACAVLNRNALGHLLQVL